MLKRISLCAVRKIIVAGEAVRQRYIRLYPRSVEKVEVLPTFTTVMPHRSIETISTLGFIGEFVKNKGIDVLLNLAPDLIKKGYHLLFCGKGVFEPQVYALQSQYPAQVRVHYFPVKQEAAFAKIDVLLMLSENENFPYVVLEAISAGIPVISTDVGVIREHYAPGEGILFLADRSKEEIMAHLERLRQNEFRKELIRKGVEKYFSKFSPEMLTDRILALYQGL